MLEKSIDDHRNVDGGRELSDTWTGFTRENKRLPGPTNDGQKCGNICVMHQNGKRKAKVGYLENKAR